MLQEPNPLPELVFRTDVKKARRTFRHGGRSVVHQAQNGRGRVCPDRRNLTHADCVASTNRRLEGSSAS